MKRNGYAGAKLLHARIEGKETKEHSILPYKILERESVKNICGQE